MQWSRWCELHYFSHEWDTFAEWTTGWIIFLWHSIHSYLPGFWVRPPQAHCLGSTSPEFWSRRFRSEQTKISDIVPQGFWSAGLEITSDFGLTPVILVQGGLLQTKISNIVPWGFWSDSRLIRWTEITSVFGPAWYTRLCLQQCSSKRSHKANTCISLRQIL